MKIMAIDDENPALSMLVSTLKRLQPDAEIVSFQKSDEFMRYQNKKGFDVAFIDINLGKISGIQVALELKKHSPLCNIVYVTSYSEFAYAAITTRPSGYIMKPYTDEDIQLEFENLRYNTEQEPEDTELLRVQTFGTFMVYDKNNQPLKFSRNISKEIFAFIVDHCGLPVTSRDISSAVLKQDDFDVSTSKKISQYVSDLIKDLNAAGYQNILIKQNRKIYIDKSTVDCDLFHLFSGDPAAINAYHGEYLTGYTWAEFSKSYDRIKNDR